MPERPRFSRFRRLPGLYRIGDDKPPDLDAEPRLLTLYLPSGHLDRAEAQSMRVGAETVQDYCADLLRRSIEAEEQRAQAEALEARQSPLESLDALTQDPDYLAAVADRSRGVAPRDDPAPMTEGSAMAPASEDSREAILRHAGLAPEDDAEGFLPRLRRGEPVPEESAGRLLASLADLERSHREATSLDRTLAYALHRLAFEGQVLLSDEPSADPATVDRLHRVQEAVDRVLSGEDIRYYPGASGPCGWAPETPP